MTHSIAVESLRRVIAVRAGTRDRLDGLQRRRGRGTLRAGHAESDPDGSDHAGDGRRDGDPQDHDQSPCAILVITATVQGNGAKVFEAMGAGALDALNTPVMGADGQGTGKEDLLRKISTSAA